MRRPYPQIFNLQRLIVDLALIDRNHYLIGRARHENDVEHSFAVAMLCWYNYDLRGLKLDLNKILKYALVHDFTEIYTGDFNTFASPADRQRKAELEKSAIKDLERELRAFPAMARTIRDYDRKADEESLFVWTVDKMQAWILGELDDWRPYKELPISYAQLIEKHKELMAISSVHAKELFAEIFEYCKTTYFDKQGEEK